MISTFLKKQKKLKLDYMLIVRKNKYKNKHYKFELRN